MDPLLTTDEAAEMLRCSARTLRLWRSEGRGPTYSRSGRRIVYRLTDLEAFIASQAVSAGGGSVTAGGAA